MKIPRIYLETTVFNFVFAEDAPQLRRDTLKLLGEIKQGLYIPYTSRFVIEEIMMSAEPKRGQMLEIIRDYGVTVLDSSDKAERLADVYVAEGVIPLKYATDAKHIAVAAVNQMDFIVSLNFKHIVKRKTVEMTEIINYRTGYKRVGIYAPAEVIDDV